MDNKLKQIRTDRQINNKETNRQIDRQMNEWHREGQVGGVVTPFFHLEVGENGKIFKPKKDIFPDQDSLTIVLKNQVFVSKTIVCKWVKVIGIWNKILVMIICSNCDCSKNLLDTILLLLDTVRAIIFFLVNCSNPVNL